MKISWINYEFAEKSYVFIIHRFKLLMINNGPISYRVTKKFSQRLSKEMQKKPRGSFVGRAVGDAVRLIVMQVKIIMLYNLC